MINLVYMPFLSVLYPAMGIPVLSATLKEAGLPCTCRYFNDYFADMVGLEKYEMAACGKKIDARVFEWLFSDILWPNDDPGRDRAFFEYLGIDINGGLAAWLYDLKENTVPVFMEDCIKRLELSKGRNVVGFSCLFQTLPSLALGKMIAQRYPDTAIAYGGPGFHGCVGEELFEKCDFIDAVALGESEDIIVRLYTALLEGRVEEDLNGVCMRDKKTGKTYISPQKALDAEYFLSGSIPDFDDYYRELSDSGLAEECKKYEKQMLLPFESSRGCWWHEKSPCRFCGLNGFNTCYRRREPKRVIEILRYYMKRYGAKRFQACDNNMSMDYFDTFLPMLQEEFSDGEIELFYCVKSNLSRSQIKQMAGAHIKYAQPGIESLSDHLLECMNKGVSALQNIFFLKCSRQYGVYVLWYALMCMYGERKEDYTEMCEMIPYLTHLNPPGGSRSFIRCHRYSVYFNESEKYFSKMTPEKWYSLLYPEYFDYEKLAYFFDHEWKDGSDNQAEYAMLSGYLEWWRSLWRNVDEVPEFYYTEKDGGNIELTDTRFGKRVRICLDEKESAVYRSLDDIISFSEISRRTKGICSPEEAGKILEAFCGYGFALERGGKYLGLALKEGFYSWTEEERAGLMQN